MTLSAFTPTDTNAQTPASKRLARAGNVASNVDRIISGAVAVVGKAVVIFAVYPAALKRLEAREGNLFDEPVLWAEIKSVAGPRLARSRNNGRAGFLLSAPAHPEQASYWRSPWQLSGRCN
jgi:hypothetical protein